MTVAAGSTRKLARSNPNCMDEVRRSVVRRPLTVRSGKPRYARGASPKKDFFNTIAQSGRSDCATQFSFGGRVSHFADAQNFLGNGGRGEVAKGKWPPGADQIVRLKYDPKNSFNRAGLAPRLFRFLFLHSLLTGRFLCGGFSR
jgi:hypothetical protein